VPVPDQTAPWWHFPFNAGRRLAALGIFERKIKCAIIMPTVDYAASFLAAGLLLGYAAAQLQIRRQLGVADHFNRLKMQPAGRKVLVYFNNDLVVGTIRNRGYDRMARTEAVYIEYSIGKQKFIDPYYGKIAENVFIIPPYVAECILAKPDFLCEITAFYNFLDTDSRTLAQLISAPVDSVIICGEKNQIGEEAKSPFDYSETSERALPFNSILQIEGVRGTLCPWINCVPTLGAHQWRDDIGLAPVIFRGSRAFLANAHDVMDGSWVAIFGANEARAEDAVTQFNTMFTQRTGDLDNSGWPEPMRGAELLGFVS
jgi:hypothetical protein